MALAIGFTREEFACKCGCSFDTVDFELMQALLRIRSHFIQQHPEHVVRMAITSACRCKKHNEDEGGSSTSQHLEAKAADFFLYFKDSFRPNARETARVDGKEVWAFMESQWPNTYGMGRYEKHRFHLDVRTEKVRWDKRKSV